MTESLRIDGKPGGWAVFRGSARLSQYYPNFLEAEHRLAAERKKAATITRSCMTCSQPFKSEGPHNRMCDDCRRSASGIAA